MTTAYRSEIVLGFVGPVGVEHARFTAMAGEHLKDRFGYDTETIRLSEFLDELKQEGWLETELRRSPECERIWSHMDAGDELRSLRLERGDARGWLAYAAMAEIATARRADDQGRSLPIAERAWLISSLKNPAEVDLLRRVYSGGFYLIGLFAAERKRREALTGQGMSSDEAERLIERDGRSEREHGQQTQATFELADAWVNDEAGLQRVLDLIFGQTLEGPRRDEHGMALAYTTALRSSDLSRQVGAAILSTDGEVLSTGYNEAPAPGGGQYEPPTPDTPTARDCDVGHDANAKERARILDEVVKGVSEYLGESSSGESSVHAGLQSVLSQTSLDDITEYGRAVHAEMSALMSAVRVGSSVRGATLYCTTFPCHSCARHIVAAGIRRVVFVEAYPKSKAAKLHGDVITLVDEDPGETTLASLTEKLAHRRTEFAPFLGVGPRRYFDLFSMRLGTGYPIERKDAEGDLRRFRPEAAFPRVNMTRVGYLEEEIEAVGILQDALKRLREDRQS